MTDQEWISEEIIFDYLEGNLSVEEREAFELLMNESEIISHEVKLWRNAYITEPMHDVTLLENSLVRTSASGNTNHFKRLLSTMVFFVLLTSSSTKQFELREEKRIANPTLKSESAHSAVSNDFNRGYTLTSSCDDKKTERVKNKDAKETIPLYNKYVRSEGFLSKPFIWKEIQVKKIPFIQRKFVTAPSQVKKRDTKRSRSSNAQKRRNEIENLATKFLAAENHT